MPPPEKRGRPLRAIPGAAPDAFEADHAVVITRIPAGPQHLRRCPRFHPLTERLHQLGPRPLGELLIEVAAGGDLLDTLERYARRSRKFVRHVGPRDWPPALWRAA
jgi:hypothetical protein